MAGCEAECFVSGILGDHPGRSARIREVAGHYHRLGGYSPYNALTNAQAAAIQAELRRRGQPLPVVCGFRHWTPWGTEALAELARLGAREIALLVMAPHQSSVSWDWYLKYAAESSDRLGGIPRIAEVVRPWWNEPGFIDAIVVGLHQATAGWSAERITAATLVFTAHAIPQPVESTAPYRRQFAETARLSAIGFGHEAHEIAFQSQPSDSSIPWSSPDILTVIDRMHREGIRDLLVCAAGFLVDHTEVLYDLDVEAQERCRQYGIGYVRARCVHDHPRFISLLADRIRDVSVGRG